MGTEVEKLEATVSHTNKQLNQLILKLNKVASTMNGMDMKSSKLKNLSVALGQYTSKIISATDRTKNFFQVMTAKLNLNFDSGQMTQVEDMQLQMLGVLSQTKAAWNSQAGVISAVSNQYGILGQQISDVASIAGKGLVPSIQAAFPAVNNLARAIQQLAGSANGLVNINLSGVMEDVSSGVSSGTGITTVLSTLGGLISDELSSYFTGKLQEGMDKELDKLGKWLTESFSGDEAGGLGKTITSMFGTSLPMILAIAAAIAVVAVGIMDLWNTSETFRDNVQNMLDIIGNAFAIAKQAIWDEGLKPLWESIKELFGSLYQLYEESGLKTIFEAVVTALGYIVSVALAGIIVGIGEIIKIIANVAEFVIGIVTGIVEGLIAIVEGVNATWQSICEVCAVIAEWFSENVIEPLVGLFQGVYERVVQFFTGLWIMIQAIWIVVTEWFGENVVGPMVGLFQGLWESVSGFFAGLWEDIKRIWETVSGWFQKNITEPIGRAFSQVAATIKNVFSSAWASVKGGVVNTMNSVIGGIESAINWIIRGINSLISGFNTVAGRAAEFIGVDWGGVSLVSEVHLSRISAYASGGFPNTGEMFLARENGITEMVGRIGSKAAVANNDQIVGGIAAGVKSAVLDAVTQVAIAMSGSRGGNNMAPIIEVDVKVDSETAYRIVKKGKEKMDRRYQVVVPVG